MYLCTTFWWKEALQKCIAQEHKIPELELLYMLIIEIIPLLSSNSLHSMHYIAFGFSYSHDLSACIALTLKVDNSFKRKTIQGRTVYTLQTLRSLVFRIRAFTSTASSMKCPVLCWRTLPSPAQLYTWSVLLSPELITKWEIILQTQTWKTVICASAWIWMKSASSKMAK